MHFDQRTQRAFREAGIDTDTLVEVSDRIAKLTAEDADRLEAFFAANDTVYSDMDRAHSATNYPEHAVEYCDLFTHSEDIRGYLRFDTWGVPVEGGRVLDDGGGDGNGDDDGPELAELELGPTVDARVRFGASRDAL